MCIRDRAMSFGKSKARLFTGDKPTVTFDDVAGSDEAKQEFCLLYTSDAADERSSVDLGGRRIIKKKIMTNH